MSEWVWYIYYTGNGLRRFTHIDWENCYGNEYRRKKRKKWIDGIESGMKTAGMSVQVLGDLTLWKCKSGLIY